MRRGTWGSRVFTALGVALALVVQGLGANAGAATRPTVVLDPDDNGAHGLWEGVTYFGYPTSLAIANGVRAALPEVCAADIVITDRHSSGSSAGRAARASQMQGADLSVTLSMNGLFGTPWGIQSDGGASSFATTRDDNLAFGNDLVQQVHNFTGRPFERVNEGPTNGTVYPYPEFAALDGTYAQVFLLYMDHNYDWPVIQTRQDLIVRALVTALGRTLQAKGFKCLGHFPALPSAAELLRLRNLGYQNFQRYGADPVSMSTGNFSTSERVFTLTGVGRQQIDLTLTYNAQSGQDSPVGVGWQFPLSAAMQQYRDGSVTVSLADGRTFLFVANAVGGFDAPAGAFASLTQVDDDSFRWASTTGESMLFDQDNSGRGKLVKTTDRQGNSITLTYGGDGSLYPRLAKITDEAGQHVAVATNDDGRITSFTRPDGATWQLDYSGSGDLETLTSARGTVRRFNYDAQHRVTSVVGQDGLTFLVNEYDDQARVVLQRNAFGQERTLVYNDDQRTTTYTDATGAVTVYHWDGLRQVTQVDDAAGGVTKTDYDDKFHPIKDIDPLGHATAYGYDASGQRSAVTDPLGHSVNSTYNATGDLTSLQDAGGPDGGPRTTTFDVNAAGLPTTVTNPDGTQRMLTYNTHGDVLTQTDELGATTTYAYDGRGNVVSVTDPLGRVSTFTYDVANRLTSETDPLGRTTSYAYDVNDNLLEKTYPNGSTEKYIYDSNDQPTAYTDRRGGVTRYQYDAELNVVAVTLPNGGIWRYTFDNENRVLSATDPLGHTTTYERDALGRVVAETDAHGHTKRTVYEAAGRVEREIDAAGHATRFGLDANGRVVTTTDALDGITRNEWDAVGRLASRTDALGRKTSYRYNFRDQVVTMTDAAGGVTSSHYDDAGRLVKTTDAVGAITRYEYDDAGQLVATTDPLGRRTTRAYDDAGNVVAVTDPMGNVVRTAYNSQNQPISNTDALARKTVFTRDAGDLVTAITDPVGHQKVRTHDVMGNLTASTDAVGRTTTYAYDLLGQRTSETAPDGVVTQRDLDPVGNLTAVIRNAVPGAAPGAAVNVTTTYAYDVRNLRTSTIDPNGTTTLLAYDALGRLVRRTDPLGRQTLYSYDAVGNRIARTDANGAVTDYDYDSRNLLLSRTYPDGSHDDFTYDAVGRQLTATNGIGTVTTVYDLAGQTKEVTDAGGKTLRYSYDDAGNRVGLTLPDGRTQTYTVNAARELTKLASPLGTVNFTYDAAGRPATISRPNGAVTTVGFNDADELTKLNTNVGPATLASLTYAYDLASNVSRRVQTIGRTSTTTSYTYDPVRRLLGNTGGPLPSSYTYDAAGNRLTWSAPDDPTTSAPAFVQTNVYDAAAELTKSTKVRRSGNASLTDVTTYTYDHNGRRTRAALVAQAPGHSTITDYAYDFEGRLRTTKPGSDPAHGNGNGQRETERRYDALGRLVSSRVGDLTTAWTLDGLDPIIAADVETTLYLRDGSGRLLGERTDDDSAWYVTDVLGSVLGASTTKTSVVGATTYSDYGVNRAPSALRFGFGGQLADSSRPGDGVGNETPPINHYYARGYEPLSGAWLQPDPYPGNIEEPASQAPYAFASNNPSTNVDHLGFLSVASPPTYSGTLTVGAASTSWTGSLQGGNVGAAYLQPTATAQQLQPTVSHHYLQPTISGHQLQPAAGWDALSGACRRKQYVCSLHSSGVAPSSSGSSLLTGLPWSGNFIQGAIQLVQGSSPLLQGPGAPRSTSIPRPFGNSVGVRPSFWDGPLTLQLLDHYYAGGGAPVTLDWSIFATRTDFRRFAETLSPDSPPRIYSTPSGDRDLYYSLHDFTVTRAASGCYTVYDYYDFDPKKGTYTYLFNLDARVGLAAEYDIYAHGCFD